MDLKSQVNDDNERYQFIIEATCRDVSRVMNHWISGGKVYTYDDCVSLFRTYLSKYFKHKFSWQYYNWYIRYSDPLGTFDRHGYLTGISFSTVSSTKQFGDFQRFAEKFDFAGFNKKNPVEDYSRPETEVFKAEPNIGEIPIEKLIDYEKINSIKFS